jgi:putative phosphoribosyl transferase
MIEFRYHNEIDIRLGNISLKGELIIPQEADPIIIFSHGSGSSRLSPRNKMVAKYLQKKNLGTLLFDLLTEKEDQSYHNRFDIELLTQRLINTTQWLENFEPAQHLGIGYFGASTGAASALKAAAYLPDIQAVVSRGGRPDLASSALKKVKSPTLLIVGSLDYDVLNFNKDAYELLTCDKKFEVIKEATHLFEEPGTMEQVCEKAGDWFEKYLQPLNYIEKIK